MNAIKYLTMLKKEIHSVVFATVDEKGLPVTRVIDVMLTDKQGIYFITAKGKAFYRQLLAQKYAAISGMAGGGGTLNKKAISIRGKIRCIGKERLDEVFTENPYMAEIYPARESRMALEVFQLYEGQGEYFDLSVKPIVRESFLIGNLMEGQPDAAAENSGYYITDKCTGCGNCLQTCPQQCITIGKPSLIHSHHCLHCGNCLEACPNGAVVRGRNKNEN